MTGTCEGIFFTSMDFACVYSLCETYLFCGVTVGGYRELENRVEQKYPEFFCMVVNSYLTIQ